MDLPNVKTGKIPKGRYLLCVCETQRHTDTSLSSKPGTSSQSLCKPGSGTQASGPKPGFLTGRWVADFRGWPHILIGKVVPVPGKCGVSKGNWEHVLGHLTYMFHVSHVQLGAGRSVSKPVAS